MKKGSESLEYKTFIKILIGVIAFFGLIYLLTDKVVKKQTVAEEETEEEVKFNEIALGQLFSRNEKEYYVLFYNSEDSNKSNYDSLQRDYLKSTTAIKLYYVNLDYAINKKYFSETDSNPKAKKMEDLKIISGTLIKILDGQIANYIEGYQEIYKITSE